MLLKEKQLWANGKAMQVLYMFIITTGVLHKKKMQKIEKKLFGFIFKYQHGVFFQAGTGK